MSLTQVNRALHAPFTAEAGEQAAASPQLPGLAAVLSWLEREGYDFMAPTPASHARVVARPDRQVGRTVADLMGWSLSCDTVDLPPDLLAILDAAALLDRGPNGQAKARIRVSRVFGNLFVHSPYPTLEQDSVFLGPDSHRFADFILRHLDTVPGGAHILDYGAGAGVGGITAATNLSGSFLTLADINPRALVLASANASFAGVGHDTVRATSPDEVTGAFDLIVTHPPFMIDPDRRAYRDGGDLYGGQLSLDWTLAALNKLAPGGRLVMHTGVSIVDGRDVFFDALRERLPAIGFSYEYRVLDPDIFGDELDKEPYAKVDRLAAIGLCVTRETSDGANG
jgi:methylase of polypeptide subunit release factors